MNAMQEFGNRDHREGDYLVSIATREFDKTKLAALNGDQHACVYIIPIGWVAARLDFL
jgi:hypothetical protein